MIGEGSSVYVLQLSRLALVLRTTSHCLCKENITSTFVFINRRLRLSILWQWLLPCGCYLRLYFIPTKKRHDRISFECYSAVFIDFYLHGGWARYTVCSTMRLRLINLDTIEAVDLSWTNFILHRYIIWDTRTHAHTCIYIYIYIWIFRVRCVWHNRETMVSTYERHFAWYADSNVRKYTSGIWYSTNQWMQLFMHPRFNMG